MKQLLSIVLSLLYLATFSQKEAPLVQDSIHEITTIQGQDSLNKDSLPLDKYTITIGLLQGGGSLFGVDFERLIHDNIGIQAGIGIVGFGAGINYHIQPNINGSFVSLQYWNQHFKGMIVQSSISINYVYRSKRNISLQLGIGYRIHEKVQPLSAPSKTPLMHTFAIGWHFFR
jgi:hypothetical protein